MTRHRRRALLLQLPVPGFLWPGLDANVPLAAGYLAAWARAHVRGWDVEILPWQEADLLGDEALLAAILGRRPDLVGLSLSLWNAERGLDLSRSLGAAGVPVVVGGPEVLPDNRWLWDEGGFAAGVPGEGEARFAAALETLDLGRPLAEAPGLLVPRPSAGPAPRAPFPPLDLDHLPSPYLSGVLSPYPDGSVWLETVRGCAFCCSYCHYGKLHGRPRAFPAAWLPDHLAWASRSGAREVYLMDASFNVRPDWEGLLRSLEAGNADARLALHTELVADALRPGDGARLAGAGLRSCEVGLQTVRAEVLAGVGRPWDRERWLRGVRELLGEGVAVTVGVIAGLPGDDVSGFRETLDFVLGQVPGARLQVFPLALLPGTDLRLRARELGLEAPLGPPYAVTRTRGFGPREFAEAFDLFEEATGLELDPLGEPDLGGPWPSPGPEAAWVSGVRLEAAGAAPDWVEAVVPRAARNLTVWVRGWRESLPSELRRLSRRLPHGVLTVALEDTPGWPASRLVGLLDEVGTGAHFLDRSLSHLYGEGARVVPRLVAVVADGDRRVGTRWVRSLAERADLVWRIEAAGGWAERVEHRVSSGAAALVEGEVPEEELRALWARLEGDGREVLFSSQRAEKAWRRLLGAVEVRAEGGRLSLP